MLQLEIKPMPMGVNPQVPKPDNRLLVILGEEGIRKMISDFYDLLVESPIKELFPTKGIGLQMSKNKSADFFIQRLGGPDYYQQKRGKPMLAARHRYFKITPSDRIEWLKCFKTVLEKLDVPEEVILPFWDFLHEFSNWMVNTKDVTLHD
jgi:hemoglobin